MPPLIGINCDVKVEEGRLRLRVPAPYVEAVVEAGGLPFIIPGTTRLFVRTTLAQVSRSWPRLKTERWKR